MNNHIKLIEGIKKGIGGRRGLWEEISVRKEREYH